MKKFSWLAKIDPRCIARPVATRSRFRPLVEALEDHIVPAVMFSTPANFFVGSLNYPLNPASGWQPSASAVGDVNGDNLPDIVTANYGSDSFSGNYKTGVSVLFGLAGGGFGPATIYTTWNGTSNPGQGYTFANYGQAYGARSVDLADFNGDGKLDILFGNYDYGVTGILLNAGDGTFTFTTPSNGAPRGYYPYWGGVKAGDFNTDGKSDYITTFWTQGNGLGPSQIAGVNFNTGNGTFLSGTGIPGANTGTEGLVTADFNNDGKLDFAVVQQGATPALLIYTNQGNGNFTQLTQLTGNGINGPVSQAVGDFNGDGKTDIAVANRGNNSVSVFLNNGATFIPGPNIATANGTFSIAAGDVNGDGLDDLMVSCTTGGLQYLEGTGAGGFAVAQQLVAPSFGAAIEGAWVTLADLNNDQALDVVLTNWQSNNVLTLMNQAGTQTTLAPQVLTSTFGQNVTLTATVSALVAGTPTGTVTFFDGITSLGSVAISGGTAILDTTTLSGGTHSITARYDGDGTFARSNSTTSTATVDAASTSTTLNGSGGTAQYGQLVTFTATVASGALTPTGTVNFFEGGVFLGSDTLTNGRATFNTSTLTSGGHNITAVLVDNADFDTSTSNTVIQKIEQALPSTPTAQLQADPLFPGNQMLVITGTNGDDNISVKPFDRLTSNLLVNLGSGPLLVYQGVTGRIVISTYGGNDTINIDKLIKKQTALDGGAGNDNITGGSGKDFITGGLGDDTLNGGAGVDRLVEAGDYDMTLAQGTTKLNGSLLGGLGTDVLYRNSIEEAQLTGGPSANVLNATGFTGNVILFGLGGNDTLTGGTKNDILVGGDNDDTLVGGAGNDVMIGGLGVDSLNGGIGDDILIGGTTSYDCDVTSLNLLILEWQNGAYLTRIAHLQGTSTVSVAGSVRLLPTTVFSDGLANTLTGGIGRDWFFKGSLDSITDLNLGGTETVTLV